MKKLLSLFLVTIGIVPLISCTNQSFVALNQLANISLDSFGIENTASNEENFILYMNNFSHKSTCRILNGGLKNFCYSPLSLYFTLSCAASGANANTRDEILNALEIDENNKEKFDIQVGKIYDFLYKDSEFSKLKIANSLWLENSKKFNEDFKKNAEKNFKSALYNVDFKNTDTKRLMSNWISENIGKTIYEEIPITHDQVLTILNTIDFKDEWVDKFDEKDTKQDTFYVNNSGQIQCKFMNKTYGFRWYVKGDGYTSSFLDLKGGGRMIFVLPDETRRVEEFLSSSENIAAICDNTKQEYGKVIFKIPKFSYKSNFNFKDILQSLGIKSAFEQDADFSKITSDKIYISDIIQKTNITINEKGVEATAFTKVDYGGSPISNDNIVELNLNRPFIYYILAPDNTTILFIGAVNDPTV